MAFCAAAVLVLRYCGHMRLLWQLLQEAQLVYELRLAFQSDNWAEVRSITDAAVRAGIHNEDIEEVDQGRHKMETMLKAHKDLQHAMELGGVLTWQHKLIDVSDLDTALCEIEKIAWNSAEGLQLKAQGHALLNLRVALRAEDWDAVEQAMRQAVISKLDSAEVLSAQDRLNFRRAADQCRQQLHVATVSVDDVAIRTGLRHASSLRSSASTIGLDWKTLGDFEGTHERAKKVRPCCRFCLVPYAAIAANAVAAGYRRHRTC